MDNKELNNQTDNQENKQEQVDNQVHKNLNEVKDNSVKQKGNKSILIVIFILIIVIVGVIYYSKLNISSKLDNNESNINTEIFNQEGQKPENKDNNVYAILNKNFSLYELDSKRDEEYQGVKLFEYDNTNDEFAEIYYISYDYNTDPSSEYSISITDDSGELLLIDDNGNIAREVPIIGGIVSSAKLKKVDLNSNIIFKIVERDSDTKISMNTALSEIDLSTDLELKQDIDQTSLQKSDKVGELSFKYTEDKNYYRGSTQHAYSKKFEGENISWSINSQYGNTLYKEEHIEVTREKNINNLSTEEAFDDLVLICNNLGQYGISDIYGVFFTDDKGELTDKEVIFTFDEMLSVAKGETVNKDGKDFTKADFDFADMNYKKTEDVTIGNGIKAIKYSVYENPYDYYIFATTNNIYYVTCPTNDRTKNVVKMFLDTLELDV